MRGRIALLAVVASGVAVAALPRASGQDDAPGDGKMNVLVLGKTQLLNDAKAFDEFCKANAKKKRGDLRTEIVAKLKEIAAKEQPKLLEELGSPKDARPLWIVNAVAVRIPRDDLEKVRALPSVKWAYPAGILPDESKPGKVETVLEPKEQEPFTTKKKKIPWNLDGLKVPKVWKDLGVLGEGVVVCSFDNGLNYRQQDLEKNVWRNPDEVANNGKDDDGNGLVDDIYGFDFSRMKAEVLDIGKRQHGTLTSSLIVGDGTGGIITGVAPRAKVMPVRGAGGPYVAARAMQYALDEGAAIMSMSFSIPNLGHVRGLWRMMAENATCAGLVLISGAGNFKQQVKVPVQIRIPEGIPCVICVGGVTAKLKPSPISSMGPVEWSKVKFYEDHPLPKGLLKPDVSAFPGPKIGLVGTDGNDTYLHKNNSRRGNSLSAPQVAGTCALMLSVNRDLTPWRVKEILEETAKDLKPRGKDPETGSGLVNAYEAVKAAKAERVAITPGGK